MRLLAVEEVAFAVRAVAEDVPDERVRLVRVGHAGEEARVRRGPRPKADAREEHGYPSLRPRCGMGPVLGPVPELPAATRERVVAAGHGLNPVHDARDHPFLPEETDPPVYPEPPWP